MVCMTLEDMLGALLAFLLLTIAHSPEATVTSVDMGSWITTV